MPLRLWWKAKDIGHLRPVRKLVHRFGRHGDLQVYHQTYYEAPEQPEHLTPEGLTELVDTARVNQWYDDLRDEYDREAGDASWRDYAWGLKRSDWEKVVNDAHKDLNETFGTDRVGVVVPATNTAFGIALNKDLVGLAYFGLLAQYWHAEVVRHYLDKLGLPYVFGAAVAAPINAPIHALKFNLLINHTIRRMPKEMTEPLLLGDESNVTIAPLPDTVIDPNSRKEIQTDDFVKRLLPLLEEGLSKSPQDWGDVGMVLVSEAQRAVERKTFEYATKTFRPPYTGLMTTPAQWDSILAWVKGHPEVFKALFSFVLPTGDRDVAVLGLYAGLKTMQSFVKLCSSPEFEVMRASDIMRRVQKDFEREVEEGKKVFGLERFPIPPRRVWETLWLALDSLNRVGGETQQGVTGTLRDLLKWGNWEQIDWSDQHSKSLKHVIAALLGHDAIKDFDDEPFRSGMLGWVLKDLRLWGSRLGGIGLVALGENLQQLKERVQTFEPSDLKQIAQKTVRKFHNTLSSVIRSVQKVRGGFAGGLGEAGKIVALIDYSPMSFYSLTKDGTCFGRGNIHHPFLLSAVKNSFVLRVFVPEVGYMGRMWGVLAPDAKTVYLTNRYGSINKPHFRGLALQIFSSLFQRRPDDLSIDEGEEVTDELRNILDKTVAQAANKIGRVRNTDLHIYLNEGDAIKISVGSRG